MPITLYSTQHRKQQYFLETTFYKFSHLQKYRRRSHHGPSTRRAATCTPSNARHVGGAHTPATWRCIQAIYLAHLFLDSQQPSGCMPDTSLATQPANPTPSQPPPPGHAHPMVTSLQQPSSFCLGPLHGTFDTYRISHLPRCPFFLPVLPSCYLVNSNLSLGAWPKYYFFRGTFLDTLQYLQAKLGSPSLFCNISLL